MKISTALYPPGPESVPESALRLSKGFRREVSKVIGSIFVFFFVYILLMLFALALAAGCIYAGLFVIMSIGRFIGLIAGLGIISIGVMVVFFLIKFIFSVKRFDTSRTIELEESAQPALFAFIRQLTEDTATRFPRKIILSPEVNACVFYNDSFWSMLFPVKKNLQIGLALVNTLTISEFKAVMAHEFGHFSQRSMKLGSFVYNVNKVIYNMLYENNSFARFLGGYSQIHWAIGLFMQITVAIIRGIQDVLQAMYSLVNKRYMALSREMEFHADAVAAAAAGSKHLISALQKIEMSSALFQQVITEANELLASKKKIANLYDAHETVMSRYASEHGLPLANGVPLPNEALLQSMTGSRIVVKNQWASHPEREEREEHLEQLQIAAAEYHRSAWLLFENPDLLQQEITEVAYQGLDNKEQIIVLDKQAFQLCFDEKQDLYKLPEILHGYFDGRKIAEMDIQNIFQNATIEANGKEKFRQLFNTEAAALPVRLANTQRDVELLQAIVQKQIDVKTFDFDGRKYNRSEASFLLENLKQELAGLEDQLRVADEERISFFAGMAKTAGENQFSKLKARFLAYFETRGKVEQHYAIAEKLVNSMAPLLNGQQISINDAELIASRLKEQSAVLRPLLTEWRQKQLFIAYPELNESVKSFEEAVFEYFANESFFETELSQVHFVAMESSDKLARYEFKCFKELITEALNYVDEVILTDTAAGIIQASTSEAS